MSVCLFVTGFLSTCEVLAAIGWFLRDARRVQMCIKQKFFEKIFYKKNSKNIFTKNISRKETFENKSILQKKFNQSQFTSTPFTPLHSTSPHFTPLQPTSPIYHRKKQTFKGHMMIMQVIGSRNFIFFLIEQEIGNGKHCKKIIRILPSNYIQNISKYIKILFYFIRRFCFDIKSY